MSNRILMTAAAAFLVAGPAFAGGFAPVAETAAPVAPVVVTPPAPSADWSGPYVGGQLGFGRASIDDGVAGQDAFGLEEDDDSGALYGLHAGYMFDFGNLVAGAEVDFDGSTLDLTDADDDEIADVGSVRRAKLRVGFDAGQLMPYVTAGIAQLALNSDLEALDDTFNGNFYGLGVSYALSDRFMVGVEGLRHNFDDFDDAGAAFEDLEADVNTVTLRGSLRF